MPFDGVAGIRALLERNFCDFEFNLDDPECGVVITLNRGFCLSSITQHNFEKTGNYLLDICVGGMLM